MSCSIASTYSISSFVGFVSSKRRLHCPPYSPATPKLRTIDFAWPMCRWPFGSVGQRVITRAVLPAARSSSTISRMKSRGFGGASAVMARDRIHRRTVSQFQWHNPRMRKLTLVAALFVAASASAQSLDDVISNVMKEYGGKAAWQKVTSLREAGTVVPLMRKGDGKLTRTWSGPGKLNVEIVYPTETEVRIVDGDHGTRNGKDVTGGSLDAMKLQAARLELPMLLVTKRATLKGLGTKDGIRTIEIPLSETLSLAVNIDLKTSRILRSTGKAGALEFVVDYSDFRRVDGLLFPFAEAGMAMGMPTANTKFDSIVVK